MKYTMPLRVRYSETVAGGQVNLNRMLEYFQDCCIFQSAGLGYGVAEELEQNQGWFLLAWNVEIERFPHLGEEIRVVTEPYKMRGFYGYRRFELLDAETNRIAWADSLWIFMDLEKKIPKRISKEMVAAYISDVEDDSVQVKRKLSDEGEWVRRNSLIVEKYYVDSNSHVNNTFYAMWAQECLPPEFTMKKVMIDYRQSAYLGDEIRIESIEEENCVRCRISNQEDTLLALVEFYE